MLLISNDFLSGWSRKWPAPKVTCDKCGGNESRGAKKSWTWLGIHFHGLHVWHK